MLDAWARSRSVRWLVSVGWATRALIAGLILDRPEALNAISAGLASSWHRVRKMLEDDAFGAMIMTSSVAKAACVGADLKEPTGIRGHDLRQRCRSSKTPSVRSRTNLSRRSPPPGLCAGP